MYTCKLVVCGETVIRDAERNVVSIINILDKAQARKFPVVFPRLSSLFIVERDDADSDVIDGKFVVDSNGEELFSMDVEAKFSGRNVTRIIVTMEGMTIKEPSELMVSLRVKDKVIGSWDISVVQDEGDSGTRKKTATKRNRAGGG